MTMTPVTDQDIDILRALLMELHTAGRTEDAAALVRIHTLVCDVACADGCPEDEDDPEFVLLMEAAERDIAAGRLIPHDDVVRRLQAIDDG